VNTRVTDRAGLILRGLVVRRAERLTGGEVRRRRVALQTDRVYVGAIQQPRVRSTVREVAGCAAFGSHDVVLVDKRARGFGVALSADQVHLGRRAEVLLVEGAVRIVTVGALQQSFFHLMVKGHVELRPGIGVALETQLRFSDLEQLLLVFAAVNTVAADAAHIVLAVGRRCRRVPCLARGSLRR
jgi:hypothetical protein